MFIAIFVLASIVTTSLFCGDDDNLRGVKKQKTKEKKVLVQETTTYQTFSPHANAAKVPILHNLVKQELDKKLDRAKRISGGGVEASPFTQNIVLPYQETDSNETYHNVGGSEGYENVDIGDAGELSSCEVPTSFLSVQDEESGKTLASIGNYKTLFSLIEKSPKKLENLTNLNLGHAGIEGTLHVWNMIGRLPHLQLLDLDNNNITSFGDHYYLQQPQEKLHYFYAKNNNLKKVYLRGFLQNCPNLKELKLDQNSDIAVDSEEIYESSNCVVFLRQCNLSDEAYALLTYNAVHMPKTWGEGATKCTLYVVNVVESLGEGVGTMVFLREFFLPQAHYGLFIGLCVPPLIALVRNHFITKGLLATCFPPEKRVARLMPAYSLVINSAQYNGKYYAV